MRQEVETVLIQTQLLTSEDVSTAASILDAPPSKEFPFHFFHSSSYLVGAGTANAAVNNRQQRRGFVVGEEEQHFLVF